MAGQENWTRYPVVWGSEASQRSLGVPAGKAAHGQTQIQICPQKCASLSACRALILPRGCSAFQQECVTGTGRLWEQMS